MRLLRFFAAPWHSAWQRRQLLRELSVREVQSTFRGSLLGGAWFVLQPLAMLAVYAIVFGGIVGLGRGGGMAFVISLFTGMVVFQAFGEPLARAPRLVVSQPNYVTKVVFPLDVLPWPLVASAGLHAATSCALLLVLQTVTFGPPAWTSVLLPALLLPVLLLGLAATWLFAALGVYLRDTHEVVRVGVQVLFFLSPIVWTLGADASEWQRLLVVLNPLAIAMEAARAALTGSAWPDAAAIVSLFVLAAVLPAAAHAVFRRAQHGFADVL